MDNNKRFVLDFEEGFIIDELVGVNILFVVITNLQRKYVN